MDRINNDDLIFLIAFLWKWADEPPVLEALIHDDDDEDDNSETLESLMEDGFYQQALSREDFNRARGIFWSLKDELVKINGFWG
jgi:hypothetical protein